MERPAVVPTLPVGVAQPTSAGAVDAGSTDVPEWAQPPRVVVMPYPEGGAYNPPLPPVKLAPWMIGDRDAGAAAPDAAAQRTDSSSTSNTTIPFG